MKSIHLLAWVRVLGLAILLPFVVTPLRLAAQEKAEPESTGQSEQGPYQALIAGLGSDEFDVRQTSFERLVKAGTRAVSVLEEGARSKTLEVATRCVEALSQIAHDPEGIESAMPALERLSKDATIQTSAFAAECIKKLESANEARVIAKLKSLGARFTRSFLTKDSHIVTINSDRQAEYLRFLPTLHSVTMKNGDITDAAVESVSKLEGVHIVRMIDASVTDDALRHLRDAPNLAVLALENVEITDAGIAHLHGHEALSLIDFKGTRVTPTGIAKLQESTPVTLTVRFFNSPPPGPVTPSLRISDILNSGRNSADLSDGITPAMVAKLKKTPNLDSVWLSSSKFLRTATFDEQEIALLADVPLKRLSVRSVRLTDDAWRALGAHPTIESLNLSRCPLSLEAAGSIGRIRSLNSLSLSYLSVSDDIVKPLISALGDTPTIKSLEFVRCGPLSDAAFSELGKLVSLRKIELHSSPNFTSSVLKEMAKLPQLKTISLEPIDLDESDLSLLSDSQQLSLLEIAFQDPVAIGDLGRGALSRLPSLETLSLTNVSISMGEIGFLGRIPSLRRLRIHDSEITDESVRALNVKSDLEFFSLRGSRMGDAGVQVISEQFPQLKSLCLAGTEITDAAIDDILSLLSLEYLELDQTTIRIEGLRRLARLGKLKAITIGEEQFSQRDQEQFSLDFPDIRLVISWQSSSVEARRLFGR